MSAPDLLVAEGLYAGYGRAEVLRGVSIRVGEGETIAIIGSNGAGKSTLMRALIGVIRPTAGSIQLDGSEVAGVRPERLVERGVALVPEGRLLFADMTVHENLTAGAYSARGRKRAAIVRERLGRVYELFPVLSERSAQQAATLSGGEQQMLAIGRALMSNPRLLLLDEPSLGLAPKVIAEIFSAMDRLRAEGVAIVLVEQDSRLALKHANRGYAMRGGRVVLEGASSDLLADASIREIYLGSWNGEKVEQR